jgi:hypothetical protein
MAKNKDGICEMCGHHVKGVRSAIDHLQNSKRLSIKGYNVPKSLTVVVCLAGAFVTGFTHNTFFAPGINMKTDRKLNKKNYEGQSRIKSIWS